MKILKRLAACATVAATLLTGMPAIAAEQTYQDDIPVTLTGSGIGLVIVAGSDSDGLDIQANTITVTVGAAEAFTLRYPGPNPGRMPNNGGLPECNYVAGNNDITVSGPATVTFTPNTTPCNPPSGGGGGGNNPVIITLIQPNGGEQLTPGQNYLILWQTTGGGETHTIRLQLSTDSGNSYTSVITQNEFDDGSYTWVVPNIDTDTARVRGQVIVADDVVRSFDPSNADFSILGTTPPPPPPDQSKTAALFEEYDPSRESNEAVSINYDKELGATPTPHPDCPTNKLIKLPTDNNPLTQIDSTVYYCGNDGRRHVFPDLKTYFTWYSNFNDVLVISADAMARIPLGVTITYKPGVKMVKIQTDPRVYAVAHNGLLRHVPDEETARTLYGLNWNLMVQDVNDAFFVSYKIGDPLPSVK